MDQPIITVVVLGSAFIFAIVIGMWGADFVNHYYPKSSFKSYLNGDWVAVVKVTPSYSSNIVFRKHFSDEKAAVKEARAFAKQFQKELNQGIEELRHDLSWSQEIKREYAVTISFMKTEQTYSPILRSAPEFFWHEDQSFKDLKYSRSNV